MRAAPKLFATMLTSALSILFLASLASAATITGSVKGPDGAPFMGAFVEAENTQNKMMTSVLSDKQGHYRIPNLAAATYSVHIRAIGYKADPRSSVQLKQNGKASFDFSLQTAPVRWTELSTYQGRMLLPKTDKHDLTKGYGDNFFTTCMISCHSFQTRMAPTTRDEDGWRDRVNYMRNVIFGGEGEGPRLSDERVNDIAAYLTVLFGPNSPKPADPSTLPEYKDTLRPVTEKATNIVYVEYDFGGTRGIGPWSAAPDKDGNMWIPYYGRGNEVVRLNPKTAELTRFPLSTDKTAGIHSAIPAPDGTVWFTEVNFGAIAHLDPKTKEIVEYRDTSPDGKRIGKHTVRVDADGNVWSSGGPISKFDPKTKEFSHFNTPGTYGNEPDGKGNEWFTVFRDDGPIVRIDKDGKITKYQPPTKGKPQRLEFDAQGNVWFSERVGNKIGRLNPTTGEIKEYDLPGGAASPYAIGIDRNQMVWYASHEQDTLNRLDPSTGEVTEYPFPQSEISMREFFMDAQGHLWFGTSSNNKVGYFYLEDSKELATK